MTQTSVQQIEVRDMLIENARSLQQILRDATLEIDQTE